VFIATWLAVCHVLHRASCVGRAIIKAVIATSLHTNKATEVHVHINNSSSTVCNDRRLCTICNGGIC